jgi:salicylate hydroxylase
MSIEDAYILSGLLGHCASASDLSVAFKAYDYVRVPRTCKVIAASREQGNLLCFESSEARSDLNQIAERLNWDRRLWMWDLDVEGHCKEALEKFEEERRAGQ